MCIELLFFQSQQLFIMKIMSFVFQVGVERALIERHELYPLNKKLVCLADV